MAAEYSGLRRSAATSPPPAPEPMPPSTGSTGPAASTVATSGCAAGDKKVRSGTEACTWRWLLHRSCIVCKTRRSGLSMVKVSAAEFQRNIGRYQDLALTQPVAVTRNGRERTVMISVEEYR